MPLMTQDDLFIPLMGSPAAAGLARTLITQRINKWNLTDKLDDALLVASELITNAAEASPGRELKLHLTRSSAGLLIQVWDPSPAAPRSRPVTPLTHAAIDAAPETQWDNGGSWGLPLIQALSTDCGFRPTPPTGKWVWSHLS
ncbi:hypothetical protein GCM10027589_25380 [Actinocorallia lasiicapitis]